MKIKLRFNKKPLKTKKGLLLALFFFLLTTFSSLMPYLISDETAAAAGSAQNTFQIVTWSSPEYTHSQSITCSATLNKAAAVPFFKETDHLPYYAGKLKASGMSDSQWQTADNLFIKAQNQNNYFETITFSGDSGCQNVVFVQSAPGSSLFYGVVPYSQGHDTFYATMTTVTSDGTITFQNPVDGNNVGPFTLNNYKSVGLGGASGGTTGGGCPELFSDITSSAQLYQCAGSTQASSSGVLGEPTFVDFETICYGGETFTLNGWTGDGNQEPKNLPGAAGGKNLMKYSLNPTFDSRCGKEGDPNWYKSTSGQKAYLEIPGLNIRNDKGLDSGLKSFKAAFQKATSTGGTVNAVFHDINGNGNFTPSKDSDHELFPSFNSTNMAIIGKYYGSGSQSATPNTITTLMTSPGTNEKLYVGTYTLKPGDTSGTGSYVLDNTSDSNGTGAGGNCAGVNQWPTLNSFSTNLLSAKTGDVVSANWVLTDNTDKSCATTVTIPGVEIVMASATDTAPTPVTTKKTDTTGGSPKINCSVKLFNPLSWFLCPLATALESVVSGLDNEINNYLDIPAAKKSTYPTNCDQLSGSEGQWCGYYNAWSVIRSIALGLIAVFALVAIVSQAMGFEVFDAYTIRKVLPRLLVAAIGISLSWPIIMWFVQFTNDVGLGVRQLIYAPFSSTAYHHVELGGGAQVVSFFAAGGAIVALGFAGLLSFVATAALAVAVAFLVLTLRQMLIVMLIIFSPIAIVCYVLPGTEKVWKLWHESFSKGLLMFPIIAAFIAIGRVFAAVNSHGAGSINQIIAFTAYFAPYFLIPFTFRLAGGAISTIGGMVNDRSRGAFDRLKKFRGEKINENMGAIKQGFDRTRLGSRLEAGKHQSIARREAWGSGAVGIGKRGSARYKAALHNSEFGHMAKVAAESIKNNPDAAANDDANKVAQYATNGEDFIRRYMASKPGATRNEAISQLTYTEQAYGASMGSTQMQHTAATAALASNSSTDTVAERATWMRHVVSSGIMTDSQAASLVKQSGSLASSAGFGDLLGAANGTLSDAELLKRASNGFNPANSHRMRKEQARELGQEMFRQADEAATTHGTGSVEFATAVANAAGIHDVLNGMTPDVREAFATELNGNAVAGKYVREHEAEMEATGNGAFLDRRKTWASTAAAAGGGTPGGFPGAGGGGGAPAGGAGGGGAGGAPSDMRLKRNIAVLCQTSDGIQLYRFKYLWSDQEYVGVIAQDLLQSHPEVLSQDEFGYYRVNYSGLGLRMMTIEEWEAIKTPAQSIG